MAPWIAVALGAVTLFISLMVIVKAYGEGLGETHEWRKSVEETMLRYARYHKEHYEHSVKDETHHNDTEAHWTTRERNDLGHRLDEIAKDVKTLLVRLSQDRS